MKEYIISDNACITDVTQTERYLNKIVTETVDIEDLLPKLKNNSVYYIDTKFNYSTSETSSSKYMWINTGLISTGNKPIFISLLWNETNRAYEGYYVGVPKLLVDSIINYYPTYTKQIRNNYSQFCNEVVNVLVPDMEPEPKDDTESKEVMGLTSDIFSQLLYNSWESIDGLERFIKIIGARLVTLIKENATEYYMMNNIKSAIINTGLIGQFNEDILILYRWNEKTNGYKPYKQITSKKEMIDEGFSKEQVTNVHLLPIKFFDGDGLLRNVTINDFDVSPTSLEHIINERRDRFPNEIIDYPSDVLATKIYDSLHTGLKMLERDNTYAKPTYSAKLQDISWFIPLHISTSFSEEPELVMVVKKDNKGLFYEVKTILPYDSNVKDRITSVALYRKYW